MIYSINFFFIYENCNIILIFIFLICIKNTVIIFLYLSYKNFNDVIQYLN